MGWMSIILFLLKYGPSIVELIIAAIKLIRWLRDNDKSVAFGDDAQVKTHLTMLADKAKKGKDLAELRDYVEKLKARRAEVEAKQKGA